MVSLYIDKSDEFKYESDEFMCSSIAFLLITGTLNDILRALFGNVIKLLKIRQYKLIKNTHIPTLTSGCLTRCYYDVLDREQGCMEA